MGLNLMIHIMRYGIIYSRSASTVSNIRSEKVINLKPISYMMGFE